MVTLKLPKASLIVDRMSIDDYFDPNYIEEVENNLLDNYPVIRPYRKIYNKNKWKCFREMKDKVFKEYVKWLKQAPDFIKIEEVNAYH